METLEKIVIMTLGFKENLNLLFKLYKQLLIYWITDLIVYMIKNIIENEHFIKTTNELLTHF